MASVDDDLMEDGLESPGYAPIMVMGKVPFWLWIAIPLVFILLFYAWGITGVLIYEGLDDTYVKWEFLSLGVVVAPITAALTFFAIMFFLRYVKRCKQWRFSDYFVEEKWQSQARFRITDGQKYGIFNRNLRKIVLPIEYDKIIQATPKSFIVEKDGKKGLFWKRKIVVPVKYETLNWDERNHRFDIVINGKQYHLDEKGMIQYSI